MCDHYAGVLEYKQCWEMESGRVKAWELESGVYMTPEVLVTIKYSHSIV